MKDREAGPPATDTVAATAFGVAKRQFPWTDPFPLDDDIPEQVTPPAADTTKVRERGEDAAPAESETTKETGNEPGEAAVPETTPVPGAKEIPEGSVPDEIDHVNARDCGSDAEIVWEYGHDCVAEGKEEVETVGGEATTAMDKAWVEDNPFTTSVARTEKGEDPTDTDDPMMEPVTALMLIPSGREPEASDHDTASPFCPAAETDCE